MSRRTVAVRVFVAGCVGLSTVGLAGVAPAGAQVTPHPRQMGLATPESTRPDPRAHRIELPGGVVAYGVADASAPLVTLTAFVGAGWVDGREGAAELVARGLRMRGPAGMEAGAFRRRLRDMAAEYSVVLGPESIEITLDVPSEDAWRGLSLLADLIQKGPMLLDGDVAALAPRESGYEGSMASAIDLFNRHVLGGTPYGHEPTAADVAALTVADARAFHERHFVAGNVVVAVGGDVDTDRLRSAMAEEFAGVRKGARHTRRATPPPPAPSSRAVLTYPADKLQGWVVVGHDLPVVPLADQAPLEVMNYILGGGHFDTRLFRETRDKRGLTNDDSGYLESNRDGPGTYGFHTSGRPEVVRLLLDITLEQIDLIRTDPVSEEELFVAKGALADGVFAARYRDGWATARTLAEEWMRDGSHDASGSYQRRVRGVTAQDVLAAARKYLHPNRMQTVIVGPIEKIEIAPSREGEGPLSQYGTVSRR